MTKTRRRGVAGCCLMAAGALLISAASLGSNGETGPTRAGLVNDFGDGGTSTRAAEAHQLRVRGVFDVSRSAVADAVVSAGIEAGDMQVLEVMRDGVRRLYYPANMSKAILHVDHPLASGTAEVVLGTQLINTVDIFLADGKVSAKLVPNPFNINESAASIETAFGAAAAVGDGDCCSANGSPGCEDAACEAAVCGCDPFCCDTEWDGFCADDGFPAGSGCGAAVLCPGLCGGGGSDCCFGHGTPGCDDPTCEAAVCGCDPFCCDTEWDSFCAADGFPAGSGCGAAVLCPGLCGDGGGGMGGADDCASAEAISGEGLFDFDNGAATQDGAGDPLCLAFGSDQVGNDVWFCWTAPCTDTVRIETCALTAVDTKIAVYDGCGCPSGSGILACNDDSCGLQSRVEFAATSGNTYLIRIGTFPGAAGGTGQFDISCITGASLCTQPMENCQAFATDNAGQSNDNNFTAADDFVPLSSGDIDSICWWGAYLPAPAADTFVVTYYDDAGGIPGAIIGGPFSQGAGLTVSGPVDTGSLVAGLAPIWEYTGTHAAVPVTGGDCYWIEIKNDTVSGATNWFWEWSHAGNKRVIVDGAPGPDGYTLGDIQLGNDFAWCLNLELGNPADCLAGPAENDDCAMAEAISGEGMFPFDNSAATTDGVGDPSCLAFGSDQVDNDVWFCWTASCDGVVRFETCGQTGVDTKIAVYDGCTCPTGSGILACNDDDCGLQSGVEFSATAGNTYLLRVGTFPGAAGGTGTFSLTCVDPPANDDCADAIHVEIPSQTSGSTSFAGLDPEAGATCGTAVSTGGVWYRVVGTGNTITASHCPQFMSNCCMGNATPGCDDPNCEAAVCACDPFCCDTQWDAFCAADGFPAGSGCGAAVLCDACMGSGSGGSADYDSKISVYCAPCDALTCIDGNDDTCGLSAEVSWCSQLGATYYILVHGFAGAQGDFVLSLTDDGLTCGGALPCEPIGACCIGPDCFDDYTEAGCIADGGIYEGDATFCADIECITDCNDNGIDDAIETAPEYAPLVAVAQDHCVDAMCICPGIGYWDDNIGAVRDTITWCGLIYGGEHDVFYCYRPKSDSQPGYPAEVRVCEGTLDPVITVHTGCPATEANQIACNFASAVGTNCGVLFPVEGGETYYIRVAGKGNDMGDFFLELFGPDCLLNPNDINEDGIPDDCQCLADVNGDGVVDGNDVNQVIAAQGDNCPCVEDVDHDGDVDGDDILYVYGNFGMCPASDCCFAQATPGCSDPACEAAVCGCDPFCCDTQWDEFCAGDGFGNGCGANLLCGGLCDGIGALVDSVPSKRQPRSVTPLSTSPAAGQRSLGVGQ